MYRGVRQVCRTPAPIYVRQHAAYKIIFSSWQYPSASVSSAASGSERAERVDAINASHNHDTATNKRIKVVASYSTTRVDVARFAKRALAEWSLSDSQCKVEKDWTIVRIPSSEVFPIGESCPTTITHISVSRRGAVVIVNAPSTGLKRGLLTGRFDMEKLLQDKSIASGLLPGSELTEELHVGLHPDDGALHTNAEEWSCLSRRGDLILRASELELDAIRILNSCMAQTINLQYFEGKVDRMYEMVQDIFRSLEDGSASKFNNKLLYKHLGDTSSISNSVMLSGLRNTVRPGSTAWNEERYAQMQGTLWSEFDLEDRYEELERRLNWISDTIKYALEVAKDNKSITLERLIVLLISAELAISVLNGGILQPFLDLFTHSK